LPSISFGHVQPFGERKTIIGQRGRSKLSPLRAALDARDLGDGLVERRRHLLVHDEGSSPSTKIGEYP
jgi:hypothetical protein